MHPEQSRHLGADSRPVPADLYPNWGFNEVDPEIETAPGTIEADGIEFPFDTFGRADVEGTLFVDAYTDDNVTFTALAIVDDSESRVREWAGFGSNGNHEFDLSAGGDGDRLAPGSYVLANVSAEQEEPRALQPLCVQAYEGTASTVSGPTPTVTVSVSELEQAQDPPAVEAASVVAWAGDESATAFDLSSVDDSTWEGSLDGLDAGAYSLHALLLDGTTDSAQIVGLSTTVSVDVPAQSGLLFAVDGQEQSTTVDENATVPYTATAEFEDGGTEDVTNGVSLTASDPAVVDIDESAAEITGAQVGTVTVQADDDGFTDTVAVTVDPLTQTGLSFAVDGQEQSATVTGGVSVPYSAAAVFEDGSTEDVTEGVSLSVTAGDPAVVDIDEGAAEITGAQTGTVTLEADDGGFTDTVEVTVLGPPEVTVSGDTAPPEGEFSLGIDGSNVATVTVEKLWTDWKVTAPDPDGGETTDAVASEGRFELDWGSTVPTAVPTVTIDPNPDETTYVGGEYELVVVGERADGATVSETTVVGIDPT